MQFAANTTFYMLQKSCQEYLVHSIIPAAASLHTVTRPPYLAPNKSTGSTWNSSKQRLLKLLRKTMSLARSWTKFEAHFESHWGFTREDHLCRRAFLGTPERAPRTALRPRAATTTATISRLSSTLVPAASEAAAAADRAESTRTPEPTARGVLSPGPAVDFFGFGLGGGVATSSAGAGQWWYGGAGRLAAAAGAVEDGSAALASICSTICLAHSWHRVHARDAVAIYALGKVDAGAVDAQVEWERQVAWRAGRRRGRPPDAQA